MIVHRKGRVGYDYAIRQAGGKLVEVGDENGASAAEFDAAFTDKTATVFVFWNADRMPGQVLLEEQIAIAHQHGVPLIVDAGTRSGIPLRYEDPKQQVGADRVANAAAVRKIYKGPACIVDFGTATIFDAMSAEGEYLGGAIAPGIGIASDALYRRTAKLPRVDELKSDRAALERGRDNRPATAQGRPRGYNR